MAAATGVLAEIIDGDVYKYYADGEWKKSTSGKSVSIINPTTRKPQYKVQGNFHFSCVFKYFTFVILYNSICGCDHVRICTCYLNWTECKASELYNM
jgi:hypothetical protein